MPGVDSTGFVTKPLADIQAEIEALQKAALGADLNTSATSLLGVLNGIFASFIAECWQVGQAIYTSFDPYQATGAALDRLSALTGVTRRAAVKSTVTLTATGTPTTVLTAGRLARVSSNPLATFTTLAPATIAALTAWANTTAYAVGDRRTNSAKVYRCITAGTSAGAGGPTTTASDITDGSVHWRYLGDGTGAVDVAAECTVTGPTVANFATITQIVTPQGGWTSVTNVLDATLGRNVETDPSLRTSREDGLRASGAAALEAIRSDVLAVSGVTECFVFENTTDVTDVDGVPPHAFEAVVSGGADVDLRAAIFGSGAAGIQPHGTTSGSVTDSTGIAHTVKFSRPTTKTIYATIDVTTDPSKFSVTGAADIKTALAVWAQTNLGIGDDVIDSQLYAPVFGVSGVVDVTKIWISLTPGPVGPGNLVIGTRELADIQTANITVNVT